MFLYTVLCLLVGATFARGPFGSQDIISSSKSVAADYLLPNNLTVDLYTLELEPNFVTDSYFGSVSIRFTTHITTNIISVHANQLQINVNNIGLLDANGLPITNPILGVGDDHDDRQFFTLAFAQNLIAGGTYSLVFSTFTGILNLDNQGFYLARYLNENNQLVKLGVTQFQPTHARRAFPCFDEPALKAQFDISIVRTPLLRSVSNMPLINSTQITPGRFRDVFARTPRMSTYLVAFVVSDFTFIGDDTHRVYSRPQVIASGRGEYALGVSEGILDTISQFVGVNYTLPKIDQIAVGDNYFTFAAMENWGAVIYRELFLMYVNNVTASNLKESIVTIIAHEYAHQWFGNLVSPLWWSYIWLNEGFATYLEYYGATIVEEDMELMDQMVIKSVQFALDRDDTTTTRPMTLDAGSPSDIWSLFDVVAYEKSGAVVRMVEGILSTSVFRRGLNIYLNKLKFLAAQPSDLYSAWQEAVNEANVQVFPGNETVESVLRTWEFNPGYPLLTVSRNYATGAVTLNQRRFISTIPDNSFENLWYIPITYAAPGYNANFNDTAVTVWLTARNATVNLPGLGVNDWLVVNIQQKGYYRVNYDTENWYRIIRLLDSENYAIVPKTSRAQLIHDSFHLARYGFIDYQVALDLSRYVVREIDYIPLFPFVNVLSFLNTFLANTAVYNIFQNYTLMLLNTAYNTVGMEEFDWNRHVTKLNRVNVLTWVCRFAGGNCRSAALDRLRLWQSNENAFILPNLQTVITCAALSIGNQNDWNFAYQEYLNAPEAVMRMRLLNGLGCSENDQVLLGYLNLLVNVTSNFPFGDRLSAWASVYNSGNHGRNFAFNYIRLFYNTVSVSFTPAQVSTILNGIASRFSTAVQLTELQLFANAVGGGEIFSNAINTAQANVNWANENLSPILNWFA